MGTFIADSERVSNALLQVNNGKDFGQSLSACPKLKCFSAYKLWGLGGAKQKLILPECRSISLDRSDDLYHLELTAPKLRKLELLDCYDLEYVRLLPREGSPVAVSIFGSDLNKASLKHLQQHPRVGRDRIKVEHPVHEMLAAMDFDDSDDNYNDDMDMEDCDFTYEPDDTIPS